MYRRQCLVNRVLLLVTCVVLGTGVLPLCQSLTSTPKSPFHRIVRDYRALTRRVTAHHIFFPKSVDVEVARTLLKQIRSKSSPYQKHGDEKKLYVVDAFERAAKRYSYETSTASNGGLIGTLVPQGYCSSLLEAEDLDDACFQAPLGVVSGPIPSKLGHHILLVTERINCPNVDGEYTKIICGENNEALMVRREEYENGRSNDGGRQLQIWLVAIVGGGIILTELAAQTARVLERIPLSGTTTTL